MARARWGLVSWEIVRWFIGCIFVELLALFFFLRDASMYRFYPDLELVYLLYALRCSYLLCTCGRPSPLAFCPFEYRRFHTLGPWPDPALGVAQGKLEFEIVVCFFEEFRNGVAWIGKVVWYVALHSSVLVVVLRMWVVRRDMWLRLRYLGLMAVEAGSIDGHIGREGGGNG